MVDQSVVAGMADGDLELGPARRRSGSGARGRRRPRRPVGGRTNRWSRSSMPFMVVASRPDLVVDVRLGHPPGQIARGEVGDLGADGLDRSKACPTTTQVVPATKTSSKGRPSTRMRLTASTLSRDRLEAAGRVDDERARRSSTFAGPRPGTRWWSSSRADLACVTSFRPVAARPDGCDGPPLLRGSRSRHHPPEASTTCTMASSSPGTEGV